MTDDHDPLKELLDKLAAVPEDVVPRGPSQPLDLTPGSHVSVTWPGNEPVEDADGNEIAMPEPTVYEMTVTDDGGMVGWTGPGDVD